MTQFSDSLKAWVDRNHKLSFSGKRVDKVGRDTLGAFNLSTVCKKKDFVTFSDGNPFNVAPRAGEAG